MKTDLNYIKKLIKIIDACNISEIEIDEEGTKLRVVKNRAPQQSDMPQIISYTTPAPQPAAALPAEQPSARTEPRAETKPDEKENLVEIKSPIVGTFYRAPSPNADPYVQIGQNINTGTVLCIIEAMKLMNEIESEVNGKIMKIMVENGQPVEYNQVLFLVEPIG
jgi:acetyl-CoA carboxylase biotin carboxyl carrier protein